MMLRALAAVVVVCASPLGLAAQEPEYEKPRIRMNRITTPIKVDGDLSDPGWAEATVIPLAYEINPGDNTTPAQKTTARIGYEISFTRYFYKPQPLRTLEEIRADIEALQKETEGLLEQILVDVEVSQ